MSAPIAKPLAAPRRGLLKSSLTVGTMTLLSRILGLVRDVVIAGYFGSTASADAFFVAFKIPNFLRRLFAEGAFSQAFVPILTEYRTKQPLTAVRALVSSVSGTLAGVLLLVTVCCLLLSPGLIRLFAPGFQDDADKLLLAETMLRITFPYLLLISLTALAGAVLNSYNQFAIPAFTPTLLNLSLISATVLMTPWFAEPIIALAWGVVIAGVAQLLLQLPFLWHIRLLALPRWGSQHDGVRRIIKLMVPALFGVSVSQINLLLDTVLASFLETGSVSWLYYSDRLSELPLGVFGIAIATVILPNLSKDHAEQSTAAFSRTLDWAIRVVLLVGLPAAVALVMLAEPLLTTLFHYGEMQARDVRMAAMSLQAYGAGLLAFMLIKVLASGYFARQDTKTPVRIAVKALVANMVLNLLLVLPLKHTGLALATTLSALMNAVMLYVGLRRTGIIQPATGWLRYAVQLLLANGALAALLLWCQGDTAEWLQWPLTVRVTQTATIVVLGLLVYTTVLLLTGLRPRHFKR